MRKFFAILTAVLTPSLFPLSADAKINVLNSVTNIFLNVDCEDAQTCDLKKFSLDVKNEFKTETGGTTIHERIYATFAIASYETDKVENLENYAIVQFIRGCKFETDFRDKNTPRGFGNILEHFGERKYFCFPEWVIDSHDTDPVYASSKIYGRFYQHIWNREPWSHNLKTEVYYGEEKPTVPTLYVRDSIFAFTSEISVQNVSLEFKTCVYRAKDVPKETSPDDLNFATPIKCFDWQSSYIYNHDLGAFETKKEIDPFCKQKPPPY